MRDLSLAHLTVIDLPPAEMIRVAARTGYQMVGLRLIPVTETSPGYPLMHERAMMRETKAALSETGMRVLDIEFVRITPDIDIAGLSPFFEAGAELGARHIITAPYDPSHERLSDRLAAMAEQATPYGLTPVLEFFPWTSVPDLATALSVVDATGRPEIGILVDALHFDRSGSRLADLASLPPSRLPLMHLCDAPVRPQYTTEELLQTTRADRLPPGEGEIDLEAILGLMPQDIPLALEVPILALKRYGGPEGVARLVQRATESWLEARSPWRKPSVFRRSH